MCNNRNLGLAASKNGVNYYIICNTSECNRPFGILAVTESDKSDTDFAEQLFFTKEEAVQCCLWLAENGVDPVTLCEVLENIYVL